MTDNAFVKAAYDAGVSHCLDEFGIEKTAVGGMIGAATGGLMGGVAGYNRGGTWQDAMLGAGGGAALGAGAGKLMQHAGAKGLAAVRSRADKISDPLVSTMRHAGADAVEGMGIPILAGAGVLGGYAGGKALPAMLGRETTEGRARREYMDNPWHSRMWDQVRGQNPYE